MALAAEHVEAAELADLVALLAALLLEAGQQLLVLGLALVGVEVEALADGLAPGQALGVAAEEDVDAAAGHVGGHRDGVQPAGLGHDLGLPGVLLGVQDLVGDAPALEQPRQLLGLGHRGRAHQHGLARLVALDDVVDHGGELGVLGLVDEVGLVGADHGHVGGDGHHGDVVGGGELGRLGLGRPRHARRASRRGGSSSGG